MFDYDEIFSSISNKYQIFDVQTKNEKIYVFGRHDGGKRFNTVINDFRPYFYVPKDEVQLDYFHPFLPISSCKRVSAPDPKEMHNLKKSYQYHYEGDIRYDCRFHSDMMIKYPTNKYIIPRYWVFDIEVFSEFKPGMPKPESPEKYVSMVTLYDSFDAVYISILVRHPVHHKERICGTVRNGNKILITVDTERQLMETFIHLIHKLQPDVMTGWNILDFDIQYMFKRLELFYPDLYSSVSIFGITPYNKVRDMDGRMEWLVAGTVMLDYMNLYKKYTQNKRESYSLDFITRVELGDNVGGKLDHEETLDQLYAYHVDRYIEYNIRDVEVLVLLDMKMLYILLVNEMKEISTSPMKYFNYENSTKFADSIICKYIRRMDTPLAMRSRPPRDENAVSKKFKGASVKDPIVGFHNWLIDLDAASMYPSIIRSLNISPETWLCKISASEASLLEAIRPYLVDQLDVCPIDEIDVVFMNGARQTVSPEQLKGWITAATGGLDNFTVATNGSVFKNVEKGIVADVQESLVLGRGQYKNLKKVWGTVSSRITKLTGIKE